MSWLTVATPPFKEIEKFDAVIAAQGGNAPDGMEVRYVGSTADGELRIVSLWESKEHAERFFANTLGPALAKVLGPEPVGPSDVIGIEVARTYARQPVG